MKLLFSVLLSPKSPLCKMGFAGIIANRIKYDTSKYSVVIFLLLISSLQMTTSDHVQSKSPKIVIIGAGAAGIAAASRLYEHGFDDVTVLEAEDRIGGRIHTTRLGNYSVDLGGQWVHGEKGNKVFELANHLGVLDNGIFEKEQYIDSLGNSLNMDLAKNLSSILNKHSEDHRPDNDKLLVKSYGEYFEKMFDKQFKDHPDILKDRKKYLRNIELINLVFDSADSWYNLPAIGNDLFEECEGENLNWKERGYSTILDILMKRFPDPTKEIPVLKNTILNNEVKTINYSNNSNQKYPISIASSKGNYEANHVIVTVSLGVLKEKYDKLFVPPLPDYKISAIQNLEFGNVAKIILLYEKPFWQPKSNKSFHTFAFVWNDQEREIIGADPEKKWMLGVSSASTVEYKPNLLCLWITSNYAREMETVEEGKVFSHTVEVLKRFLGKTYNVTKPIAMLRSRWYTNPHFRGTYSYRSIRSKEQQALPETLEKPVSEDNLAILFAGEATSHNRFSTVDGAIGSGWKAADRLIAYHRKNV